jgi:hypothetical protein
MRGLRHVLLAMQGIALAGWGFGCVSDQSYDQLGNSSVNSSTSGTGGGTAGPPTGPPQAPVNFQGTNCTLGYTPTGGDALPGQGGKTYPSDPTQVAFNESGVLVAFSPTTTVQVGPGLTVNVWYSDEHAMTLGVRQIVVKSSAGTTTTDYPLSAQNGNPGFLLNPQVGATALTGAQAGVDTSTCSGTADACSRPMWPALFLTDITANAASKSGDWQYGGTPIAPTAIYGSWKGAVRTVDQTQNPPAISIATDNDPAQNHQDLGSGIPVPPGVMDEGYMSLVRWDVSTLGLKSGHSYRVQFMVHDGDQNQSGGDVGQNCINLSVP